MDVHLISPSLSELPDCDFYISSFEYFSSGNLDINAFAPSRRERFLPPVIVICPSPRIAHSMFVESRKQPNADIVEFISQPCGPRKLAKSFETCSKRRRQEIDTTVTEDDHSRKLPNSPVVMEVKESELDSLVDELTQESRGQSSDNTIEGNGSESPLDQPDLDIAPETPPSSILVSSEDLIDPKLDEVKNLSQLQNDQERTTILIVDDNYINVRILVEFMKKLGCNYATASNGLEALEFFKANAPSIALILMGMFQPWLFSVSICI